MAPSRPRRKLFAHPSTLALAAAGSSARDVAEAAGVSQSYVSQALAGVRPVSVGINDALIACVGEQDARGILALIPRDEPEQLAA